MDLRQQMRSAAFYVFFGAVVCLLLWRPNTMLVSEPLDDSFYLSQVQHILGEPEIMPPRLGMVLGSFTAPGTSWIWTAPALGAKLLWAINGGDLQDWTWAALAIFGFWAWLLCYPLTVWLLETWPSFATLRLRARLFFGGIIFLNLPLLSNALGHPLSPHIYETVLALAMALAIRRRRFALAALAAAGTMLTRYNDAPAILMVIGGLADVYGANALVLARANKLKLLAIAGIAGIALYQTINIAFFRGYGAQTLQHHFSEISSVNVYNFFFHWGHGTVLTYCFWVAMLLAGIVGLKRLSWSARGGLVWMAAHIFLYSFWGGPGASMGHRYLCGTYAAAIVIFGELFLAPNPVLSRQRKWALFAPAALAAAWLSVLMATFCTCQQLNYSVVFDVPGKPGMQVRPFYFTRFFAVIDVPRLYSHLFELGLIGSTLISELDPHEGTWGEAVLPGDSVARKFARDLLLPETLLLAVAAGLVAFRRQNELHQCGTTADESDGAQGICDRMARNRIG